MEMMKNKENKELFHVVHKVPSGDGPYVRAKHAQLVEKEPETAIVWFWKAINGGDRVDSALKDMCVVMKQLHRTEEAIEAIYSFRSLCSQQAQESLDNVLLDLLKGNLGWAYMQKGDFMAAEVIYKKAQMIDADSNKACNLAHCLIKQARYDEARNILEDVWRANYAGSDDPKTKNRVEELVLELDSRQPPPFLQNLPGLNLDDDFVNGLEQLINAWAPSKSRRLPIFEEISTFKNQLAC
ncbi:protein SULFUR DEFICIENCY-INDUCED 1-like isoform X2 [Nicotiana tomentosiformis]|uniref:protein SULFUR DEFICIENCY-INDUCED 1-like isoform X2 n=1 Tax=Nicotiana tomentosiformis TaxID=4098 RepID=UPI0014455D45|nr:protein SULFUR DEFICIENCY-INDUCED 1-like isoform X2 [Nicotiana tomentosiformis]